MTDIEQKQIFSKNLNRYLAISNKTQKEVADSIHVSPQTFNTWCQGIALPRMGKVQLLADYFGIEKSDLIDNKPFPEEIFSPESAILHAHMTEDKQFTELYKIWAQLNDIGKLKLMDNASDLVQIYKNNL